MFNFWHHGVLIFLFTSSLAILINKNCRITDNERIAETNKGKVIGQVLKNAVHNGSVYTAFKGIPYAQPALGERRFKKAEDVKAWTGCLNATQHGNFCIQGYQRGSTLVFGSEDCHYLNVYTLVDDFRNNIPLRPVIVWIHGGFFLFGHGNSDLYGPDLLVEKNVVVVTFNYRLGPFGFLNLYQAEAPGNAALKDQVMVLEWVKKNIANFGGDPNKVTIMGHSAGGIMVDLHLVSPKSEGLFQQVAVMSCSAYNSFAIHPKNIAIEQAKRLALKLQTADPTGCYDLQSDGFYNEKDSMAILLQASAEKMAIFTLEIRRQYEPRLPFAISPEDEKLSSDHFFSGSFHQYIRSGEFKQVPHLMGFTDLEFWGFRPYMTYTSTLTGNMSLSNDDIKRYFEDGSDAFFAIGIDLKQRILSMYKDLPVFYYHFKYCPLDTAIKGAGHGDDVSYLFYQPLFVNGVKGIYDIFNASCELLNMSCPAIMRDKMISFYTNFAKSGDPSINGSIKWDRSNEHGNYMKIDGTSKMENNRPVRAKVFVEENKLLREIENGKCDFTLEEQMVEAFAADTQYHIFTGGFINF